MTVDINTMKQLAEIAAIEMGPEEVAEQTAILKELAACTANLLSVETEGLPRQTHPFADAGADGANRLREDVVTSEDHAKEFTAAAPDSKGAYFRVPRTVEE